MRRLILLLVLAGLPVLLTGCASGRLNASSAQASVDRVVALLEPHASIFPLLEAKEWTPKKDPDPTSLLREKFDANKLLGALPRLSLRPGTVLDYVYHRDKLSGAPVLYARSADARPFSSFPELTNAVPVAPTEGRLQNLWSKGIGYYVNSLAADGTEESYFQLVVMYLMGDQFFHFWHDGYHDELIVCAPSVLDALLLRKESVAEGRYDRQRNLEHAVEKARALPLAPTIVMNRDTVEVSVVIFTKFGGFQRRHYTLGREPPHRVLRERWQELVPYHCGYVM